MLLGTLTPTCAMSHLSETGTFTGTYDLAPEENLLAEFLCSSTALGCVAHLAMSLGMLLPTALISQGTHIRHEGIHIYMVDDADVMGSRSIRCLALVHAIRRRRFLYVIAE